MSPDTPKVQPRGKVALVVGKYSTIIESKMLNPCRARKLGKGVNTSTCQERAQYVVPQNVFQEIFIRKWIPP